MHRLATALDELKALKERAQEIQSLDQFKAAIGKTSVPKPIQITMIDVCRRSCPIPSPAPGFFVFHVQEVLDWGIDEMKNYIGKES